MPIRPRVRQRWPQLPSLRAERADMANTVQRILEGRLTRVIKEAGLTRRFGGDVVWPPVNIEFQNPPSVLVKSPRNEIRIESQSLLEGDLPDRTRGAARGLGRARRQDVGARRPDRRHRDVPGDHPRGRRLCVHHGGHRARVDAPLPVLHAARTSVLLERQADDAQRDSRRPRRAGARRAARRRVPARTVVRVIGRRHGVAGRRRHRLRRRDARPASAGRGAAGSRARSTRPSG